MEFRQSFRRFVCECENIAICVLFPIQSQRHQLQIQAEAYKNALAPIAHAGYSHYIATHYTYVELRYNHENRRQQKIENEMEVERKKRKTKYTSSMLAVLAVIRKWINKKHMLFDWLAFGNLPFRIDQLQ